MHVVRPIPFSLDDRALKRSGLDYWDYVALTVHPDWHSFADWLSGRRWWLFTTRASRTYTDARFEDGDVLLFGNEPHGVPGGVHAAAGPERSLRIPMLDGRARSLNLSMSAAVATYEALRQTGAGPRAPESG